MSYAHHQVDQYIDYGSCRRRRKKEASLFKEIIAKNFSNLGKEMDIQIKELKDIHIKTHYNQIVENQRQRENFESSKTKATHYVQGTPWHNHQISE